MGVTVTYGHAAPHIAQQAAYAAHRWKTSRLLRDRNEGRAEMFGFVKALEILLASSEGKDAVVGIAEAENLPFGAEAALRAFIGPNAERMLGPDTGKAKPW